jgi:DNA helicase-2/ATP-dependent DNA helicase PcrA
MQERAGQRGVSQAKEARHMIIDATAVPAYDLGVRVFHQKFGYGAVIGTEGDKLEIAFDKAGVKKVVAKFVTAADDIPF